MPNRLGPSSVPLATPIALGGTGATTAAGALTGLGAVASANPSFTGTQSLQSAAGNISERFYVSDAGTDAKYSDFVFSAGGVSFRLLNDTFASANTYLNVTRTGYVATTLTLTAGTINLSSTSSVSVGGPLAITDPATGSTNNFTLSAPSGNNGANFRIVGNGTTTPNKTLRVYNGNFGIINNAYTNSLFNLDDSGNMAIAGAATFGSPLAAAQGGTGDAGGAWTASTPVLLPATGTFGSASATLRYKKIGRILFFQGIVTVTTNGTAAGSIVVVLPYTAAATFTSAGRETTAGKMLQVFAAAGNNSITLVNYDNTYPAVNGSSLAFSGVIETTT